MFLISLRTHTYMAGSYFRSHDYVVENPPPAPITQTFHHELKVDLKNISLNNFFTYKFAQENTEENRKTEGGLSEIERKGLVSLYSVFDIQIIIC